MVSDDLRNALVSMVTFVVNRIEELVLLSDELTNVLVESTWASTVVTFVVDAFVTGPMSSKKSGGGGASGGDTIMGLVMVNPRPLRAPGFWSCAARPCSPCSAASGVRAGAADWLKRLQAKALHERTLRLNMVPGGKFRNTKGGDASSPVSIPEGLVQYTLLTDPFTVASCQR